MKREFSNVTILGSTGSIGVNTLDVISQHPDLFSVFALSAMSCFFCLSVSDFSRSKFLGQPPLDLWCSKIDSVFQLPVSFKHGSNRRSESVILVCIIKKGAQVY